MELSEHPSAAFQAVSLLSFQRDGCFAHLIFWWAELLGPDRWEPADSCPRRQQINTGFSQSAFLVH